jgi:T-complex protein 1 subunit alpha
MVAHQGRTTLMTSLDKMLVDNVGDVTITNDGATILSLLEVSHPAVRVTSPFTMLEQR